MPAAELAVEAHLVLVVTAAAARHHEQGIKADCQVQQIPVAAVVETLPLDQTQTVVVTAVLALLSLDTHHHKEYKWDITLKYSTM